jgi:SAM-dependent methyltransferase
MNPFKSKQTMPFNTSREEQFLRLCYQQILQRPADRGGVDNYLKLLENRTIDHAGILEELLGSDEYRHINHYDYRLDPQISAFYSQFDIDLTSRLKSCETISEETYEKLWSAIFQTDKKLVIGQNEYGRQHKQRFWELCNALGELIGDNSKPKILEFGVSEFSAIYRQLFPFISLDCADRPATDDYIGFNKNTSLRVSGGEHFISVDLNAPAILFDDNYQHLQACYDLVIFTEVLEHLTANPVDILKQLITLLAPQGCLYLTTPNFFRKENHEKFEQRENPQEIYPPGENNWDAHHHHREYGLKEMLRFTKEAGGYTKAFYFSDCWDDSPIDHDSEKSNMVFVIQSEIYAKKSLENEL